MFLVLALAGLVSSPLRILVTRPLATLNVLLPLPTSEPFLILAAHCLRIPTPPRWFRSLLETTEVFCHLLYLSLSTLPRNSSLRPPGWVLCTQPVHVGAALW